MSPTMLVRRIAAWLRRSRLDDELRDELAQHVNWRADALAADGLAPDEARRRAAVEVGNLTRLREEARTMWGFPSIDSIAQDVRYGARQVRRAPVFTLIAVLSLAIGIGAGTAVFSLADAAILRTMAVRDPSALRIIEWTSGPVFPFSSLNGYARQNAAGLGSTSFSLAAYQSFHADAARYVDVLGFADLYQVNASIDGRSELATAHAVSGNYFDVLGVAPAVGRALGAIDDARDADPALVISHRLWKSRFGGDPGAVGRIVAVNSVSFTVVGVLPPAFHGTGQIGTDPDLYVPLSLKPRVVPNDDPPADPNFWWVLMLGRLKPGVGEAEARDAMDVLLKRTVAAAKPALSAKDYPGVELLPGGRGQVENREEMRDPLKTMALVTLTVLLAACANVAGLLLARGRARAREISIRVAIGAPRTRMVRQLLTEAALIAAAGGALGVAAATWLSGALAPALGAGPEATDLLARIDLRVLAFATLAACACALLFGVVPAFRATDLKVGAGLQEASRGAVRGSSRRVLSGALIVAQIALSLLLVAGAVLLMRTVGNLQRVDLGFNPSNLLLFRVDPSLNGYEGPRTVALYSTILDRLRATPGVTQASLSSHRLVANSSSIGVVARTDEARPAEGSSDAAAFERSHLAWMQTVDEGFFSTLAIPFARGRTFEAADAGGPPVAVINRALAKQLYQSGDAVGHMLNTGSRRRAGEPGVEVIGVVEDAVYTSMRSPKPPTLYLFYRQHPEMKNAPTFEVRTAGSPGALAVTVRELVRSIDPNLPVYGVITQQDQIAASISQEQLFARLAAFLALVAALLAGIGLYGLLAYTVATRVPEIGLRMALGAARGRMQWMVLRESLVLAGLGVAAGVPLALFGTRILAAMLFGLPPRDPVTLGGAAVGMFLLAVLAGYLPARRASRVDPLVALRAE